MSSQEENYSAPSVFEYDLDPGGNYVSPAQDPASEGGQGVLSASIVE
ncbi:MAG: hypothetical protein K9M45_00610 [Kiritimatiellales bacterium]|nr:hypothetical protein [Kiritimatiellales bacterium]